MELLLRHRGRLGPVAAELGVSVRTVQRRLRALGLQLDDFRRDPR
jgi:DNA-binding NtrC family response regulator